MTDSDIKVINASLQRIRELLGATPERIYASVALELATIHKLVNTAGGNRRTTVGVTSGAATE